MLKLNALKRIPDFSGDDDVEKWIDRVESAIRIDGVPEENRADVIIMRLDGPARMTWKAMPADQQLNFSSIKARLRETYGMRRYEAWTKIHGTIDPTESLDSTWERIKSLVSVAASGNDPIGHISACIFLSQMAPEIRDKILLHCGQSYDPQRVLDSAKSISIRNTNSDVALAIPCASNTPAIRQNQSNFRCERCERHGHVAKDYRASYPLSTNRDSRTCYQCGKGGHIARNCPNGGGSGSASTENGGEMVGNRNNLGQIQRGYVKSGNEKGDSGAPLEFPRNNGTWRNNNN